MKTNDKVIILDHSDKSIVGKIGIVTAVTITSATVLLDETKQQTRSCYLCDLKKV